MKIFIFWFVVLLPPAVVAQQPPGPTEPTIEWLQRQQYNNKLETDIETLKRRQRQREEELRRQYKLPEQMEACARDTWCRAEEARRQEVLRQLRERSKSEWQ